MHSYERPTTIPDPFPSFADFRFNDALDVVAFAELDLSIGLNTWPDVWHLDDEGQLACAGSGSSCDTIKRWALDPRSLLDARRAGLASADGCADRWVIVDACSGASSCPSGSTFSTRSSSTTKGTGGRCMSSRPGRRPGRRR